MNNSKKLFAWGSVAVMLAIVVYLAWKIPDIAYVESSNGVTEVLQK